MIHLECKILFFSDSLFLENSAVNVRKDLSVLAKFLTWSWISSRDSELVQEIALSKF